MSNSFDPKKISPEAMNMLKSKGIDPGTLKSTDASKLLSSLNKSEADKINALLNDKEALEKMLSSDRAKAVINQLFGGAK